MTAAPVTVYTTGPQCMKCTMTKKQLDKRGVAYTEVRLDLDDDIAEQLKANGFTTAPIVEAHTPDGVERWSDFRPDRIDAVARAVA